jgi:hypothetical protein
LTLIIPIPPFTVATRQRVDTAAPAAPLTLEATHKCTGLFQAMPVGIERLTGEALAHRLRHPPGEMVPHRVDCHRDFAVWISSGAGTNRPRARAAADSRRQ